MLDKFFILIGWKTPLRKKWDGTEIILDLVTIAVMVVIGVLTWGYFFK